MKARKILLKKFIQIDPFTNEEIKDQQGKPAEYSYRQQLWLLLRSTNPNESLSTDELMKRAQVQFLLEQAKDNEPIFLEDEHYQVLQKVLKDARWGGANKFTADMIQSVNTAEEVELTPKEPVDNKPAQPVK